MFPQRALKISAKTLNWSLQTIKHWYRVSGAERMSSWQPVLLDSPTAAFGTVEAFCSMWLRVWMSCGMQSERLQMCGLARLGLWAYLPY